MSALLLGNEYAMLRQSVSVCVIFVGGWVHSVCFSASGTKLAWVGHDSSISVVDAANGFA